MFKLIIGIVGFILLIISIILAVFFHYPFYYTILILGWFLFFDYLSIRFKKESVMEFFIKKGFRFSILIFFLYVSLGILADYVYGRKIASAWVYPSYSLINYSFLYLVIYPLGPLGMYNAYNFIGYFIIKEDIKYKLNLKYFTYLGSILLLIPIINYFFNNNYANYIFPFSFIGALFIFDYIALKYNGNSFIKSLFNKNIFLSMTITTILGIIVHEYTNIFAKEWQYINLPFTNVALFDIPVIVILGWIILTAISISSFNMVKAIGNR